MTTLFNFLKIFNLNLSVKNAATSALLGFSLGMLPLFSPLVWGIIILSCVIRLHAAYLALFWLIGEVVGVFLHQPIAMVGEVILTAPPLQHLWQQWYEQIMWRLLSFNHTYVMGASALLLVCALPLWFLCYRFIHYYQKKLMSPKLKGWISFPIVRQLFGVNTKGERPPKGFMRQWINLKGGIFLVGLSVVVVTLSYVVQTSAFKRQLKDQLAAAWGAPVSIGELSLSISPLGFSIQDLRLFGLKNNQQEALSIGNLTAHASLYHLLSGKWVFPEMQFSKLLIDANELSADKKASSTDDSQQPAKSSSQNISKLLENLPSVETMLSGELVTEQKSHQLEANIQHAEQGKQEWQQSIPSTAQYQRYKKQIERLQKRPFDIQSAPQRLTELEKLQVDIHSDWVKFDQAIQALRNDAQTVRNTMQEITKAVAQDWQRIDQKYQLLQQDNGELIRLLLGEKVKRWIGYGYITYTTVKPYIEEYIRTQNREKTTNFFDFGRYIHFQEKDPQPDFNIQHLVAEAGDGNWRLQLKNINFDQQISRLATTGRLRLDIHETRPKTIDITIDHRNKNNIINRVDFANQGLVRDKIIVDNEHLSMVLQQAQEREKFTLNLNQGELDGTWQQEYSAIVWDSEKMNQARGNAMRPGLFNNIIDFQNRVRIHGSLDSPKVDIQSNLDNRLYRVLREAMQQSFDTNKRKARDHLYAQTKDLLNQGRETYISLSQAQKKIATRQRQWQTDINRQLDEYKEKINQQITSKPAKKIEQKAQQKTEDIKRNLLKQFQ